MKTINLGARSVNVVVGYRNLGELRKDTTIFRKSFERRLFRFTKENLHETYGNNDWTTRKVYKEMKKYAFAQLEGKQVTTSTVMVQLMRLHQITCGHFTLMMEPCKRYLQDVLMNYGHPRRVEGKAVIWSHYQKDVQRLIKK